MQYTEIDKMYRDAGDVGGDLQTGPSFNRRFMVVTDNSLIRLDFYTYEARGTDASVFVQTQVQLVEYEATGATGPFAMPDGAEIRSDAVHWDSPADDDRTAEQRCAAIGEADIARALTEMS